MNPPPITADQLVFQDLLIDAAEMTKRLVNQFEDGLKMRLNEALLGGGVLSLHVHMSTTPVVSMHISHPNGATIELLRTE